VQTASTCWYGIRIIVLVMELTADSPNMREGGGVLKFSTYNLV